MKKLISIITTVALMGTLAIGCTKEDKEAVEKMGLNLAKGESFSIDYKMNIDTTISASGQEVKMPITMDMGTTLDVKSIDGEELSFGYTIDKQKMSMNFLGQSMVIDTESDTPEGKEMKKILDQMKMTIITDNYGTIKKFELPSELQADKNITKLLEEQKGQMGGLLGFFPKDLDVKVGSEWEKEQTQSQNDISLSYKEKFKVSKIENGKIYVESVITSNGNDKKLGDIEITGNGTYVINENHLPESFGYLMIMKTNGESELGNGVKGSMKMEMDYKGTVAKK